MDAKSNASFINSVASGQKIPCPNCNTLNDIDSLFCATCGTKLGLTCPSCNKPNESGAMFCAFCGTKLNQSGADSGERIIEQTVNDNSSMVDSSNNAIDVAIQPDVSQPSSQEAELKPVNTPAFATIPQDSTSGAFSQKEDARNESSEVSAKTPAFKSTEPEVTSEKKQEQVIQPSQKKPHKKRVFQVPEPVIEDEPEEVSVFAQGLPNWDIVPPLVAIRRKKK